jgi:hypothetical protein
MMRKILKLDACKDFVQTADGKPGFLNTIITGEESWWFQYDPETKRQSVEWQLHSSPRPTNKSCIKIVLNTFFDSKFIWNSCQKEGLSTVSTT